MTNDNKLLAKFRVSDDDLYKESSIGKAYDEYFEKRSQFGVAASELKAATKTLHEVLDGPLRAQGLVAEGRDWTFKEDDDDGICISVWSETKKSGRQRSDIPIRQLTFANNKTLGDILGPALRRTAVKTVVSNG